MNLYLKIFFKLKIVYFKAYKLMTFDHSGADKMPLNYKYKNRTKTSMKKQKIKKISVFISKVRS